jgi:succinate dehydrogenase/fumarate reductase flavoprotein subunit
MEGEMKSIEELGTVVFTDVLVLGGGAAGLCAAIKAKESQVDVLVVDKGGIGWAGQVPLTAGGVAYIYPEDVDKFCKWVTEYTNYLNNQDWTYILAQGLTKAHIELGALGVPFLKTNGEFVISTLAKDSYLTKLDAPKAMIKLKSAVVAKGIKTLDKVYVIDLLQRDGQVVGAIGFGLVDGKTYIFNAKAVIIATGTCRFQAEKEMNWTVGEGLAMAYRIGAQLMNAEFRNFYLHTIKALAGKQITTISPYFLYSHLENSLGERITDKYRDEILVGEKSGEKKDDSILLLLAMLKETEAGRGPIYLDIKKLNTEEKKSLLSQWIPQGFKELYSYDGLRLLKDKVGIDPEKEKIEIEPLCGGGQGTVRIDLQCHTTVSGLWAAGDAASLGSGWSGSRLHLRGGTGIGFAVVSGFIAGQSAGRHAAGSKRLKLDLEGVKRVKERVFAPLGRAGDVDVTDVLYQIHEAVVPMKYAFMREAGRMKEALEIIEKAKENLTGVGVSDFHDLSRYHQADSMILAGELTYKAALLREESRGHHLREDFPVRDDKNWLKWIIIKQEKGIAAFSTEPVPIEKYRLKPPQS